MKVTRSSFFIFTTSLWALLLCWPVISSAEVKQLGVKTVVIDAGHGGKDPGTCYKTYREKDINLNVALLFGSMIRENLPDVKVIYTRNTDVFVPLSTRGEIANKANADLFISIHVNAVNPGQTSPSGALTLVMGTKDADRNLEEAMRENDVITYEEDYNTKYEGYIPGSTESFIIFSLMQYANIDQSMTFANILQRHYKVGSPMPDKGVRQQPILVLWKTAMPSVLTELGFLSNAKDRETLTTSSGQKKLARTLFNAFSEYKSKMEGSSHPIQLDDEALSGETTLAQSRVTSAGADRGVLFCVQVCSSTKRISLNDAHEFKSYRGKVTERRVDGRYKYFACELPSYEEADRVLKAVRKTFPDAFMVAFDGDRQISVDEARKLK